MIVGGKEPGDDWFSVVFDVQCMSYTGEECLRAVGHRNGKLVYAIVSYPSKSPRITKEEAMRLCKHDGMMELLKRL